MDHVQIGTLEISSSIKSSGEKKENYVDLEEEKEEDDILFALSPRESLALLSDRREKSVINKDRTDAVRLLSTGLAMTKYTLDPTGLQSIKQSVFVFYDQFKGVHGSLFWNDASLGRTEDFKQRLPLSELTEVLEGKQSAAFQTPTGGRAVSDRSCTLVTPKFLLNLEAKSASQLTSFLCSLNSIKTASGAQLVADQSSTLVRRPNK